MTAETKPGMGLVVVDGPDGKPRKYLTALFGDGALVISIGTWDRFGCLQVLGAAEPKAPTELVKPGMPKHKAILENIDPAGGMMLLFKDAAGVRKLIETLHVIAERMESVPTPQPMMRCPACAKEYEDFDGLGVLYCAPPEGCGYCRHASRTGKNRDGRTVMVCDYCKHYKGDGEHE